MKTIEGELWPVLSMGKVKTLIGVLVIAALFYVGWSLIPPYFHNYALRDDLDEIARRNAYTPQKTDDDLRAQVIKQASDESIILKEDQITITRTGDGLAISVHYKVHVDMLLHPMDLEFTTNSLNARRI